MVDRYLLPTIDGKPAAMSGGQLCFCDELPRWQDRPHKGRLYETVEEVKAIIARTIKYRAKHGYGKNELPSRYGWVLIRAPKPPKKQKARSPIRRLPHRGDR